MVSDGFNVSDVSPVRVLRHAGLGRPAGHADTPLDDQQAMLGLHQTNCFMTTTTTTTPTTLRVRLAKPWLAAAVGLVGCDRRLTV